MRNNDKCFFKIYFKMSGSEKTYYHNTQDISNPRQNSNFPSLWNYYFSWF
jgi:hypothetical protein